MGLFDNILGNHINKRDREYVEMTEIILEWDSFIRSVLNTRGFIARTVYRSKLSQMYKTARDAEKLYHRIVLLPSGAVKDFREVYFDFERSVNTFESLIDEHNTRYLQGLIAKARESIGKVEGYELDDQQMACVVKDSHNHNVVAGAGTGKTTTIIGKVKYLLATGKYKPEEILVLSYTRAAALEMKERLMRNTNEKINVSTFHSYGYQILTAAENKKPSIFSDTPYKILKKEVDNLVKDKSYRRKLFWYIGNGYGTERTDLDPEFRSYDDYAEFIREHGPVTIKGEKVKSIGEAHLANYLASYGVRYIYERPYEYNTADEKYAQYTPDFYLPDYGIYIEYFGIDHNGQVPEWFVGDNPSQTYRQGMEWKRKLHRQHGTKLIEFYAYEDYEGTLQDSVENKLREAGVEIKDVSFDELLKESRTDAQNVLSVFISSSMAIINLARNRKMKANDLLEFSGKDRSLKRIGELVAPLQEAYEQYLSDSNQIDFSDMLIRAEQYVKEKKYNNPFKCVIVDEYQDITASQYRLLKALRENADFNLFCVGDDWQSIYRFNGSDVSYIMDFDSFWGDSELSRIETTYRFSQSLIDISGSFIMRNPRQIKKSIKSGADDNEFAVSKIEGYQIRNAVSFMADRMRYLPDKSTVFFIGRYTFDIKMLANDHRFSVKYDTATQTLRVYLQGRPDLTITFYTAHRSKGLQADYVYILNNMSGTLGFPSKVESNPLTDALLEHADAYPFAEERRLYYVALTRARKHVYLLTVKDKESVFLEELQERYGGQLKNETYICPECGGRLRIVNGPYGKFLGCENFNSLGCDYKEKIT